MIRKKLEWMKRGFCIFLAGTMILCSDVTGFAAALPQQTEAVESTEEAAEKEAAEKEAAEPEAPVSADSMTESTETAEPEEITGTTGVTDPAESAGEPEGTEPEETAGEPEGTEPTETAGEEGTEPEETAGEPEGTEPTETAGEPEGTEPTETAGEPEGTEPEETAGEPEGTEPTETAGEEETEQPEKESDIKTGTAAEAGAKIVLNGTTNYAFVNIGESVTLPGYQITYQEESKAPEDVSVKWVSDDMGVAELNADAGTAKALKAGVAYLKLQLVSDPEIYAEYRIVVRPEAPATAQVTAATYNSVQLAWARVSDADGYIIYRRAENESDYEEVTKVKGEETLSYTDDNGLLAGTSYAYRIFAYISYTDADGQTQYAESSEKAVVTAKPALGQVDVTGITSGGYNSATLTWNGLSGATGYTICRATGSSSAFQEIANVDGDARSYTDQTLSPGQSYRYKVKGYLVVNGGKVYGTESSELTVKPVPAVPELSISSSSYKSVKLGWSQVPGASGYGIYRKVSGTDSFKKIATVKKGTTVSYKDESVTAGTKYVYKVRAYVTVSGTTVWGEYSAEKSITPNLSAPQVSLASVTYNSATVSWEKVSGAEGYKVLRSTSADSGYKTVKTIKNTSTLSYTDSGLTIGKTYYYKVCAYRAVSGKNVNGKKSDAASVQIVPDAPKVKAEAAGATAIKITWEKVGLPSSNSGYYVYQVVNDKDVKLKTCGSKTTSYTVKNLNAGTQYTFKVAAYAKDSSGNIVIGKSSSLTVAPELLPITIESVTPYSYKEMRVTWKSTSAADEDSYVVYRSTSPKSGYKKIGTVKRTDGKTEYTYKDKTVSVGKKYYYKIRCTKTLESGKTMKSGYSAVASATAAPGTPTVTVEAAQYDSLKITWKKVKGPASSGYVNGYVIYRSTSENGTYKKVKTITSGKTVSYTDGGLAVGKTYYYKIRAYCTVNKKNIYGDYSAVASKKVVPGTPSIKATATNYDTVTVSWNAVSGCDGYTIYRADSENGTYKSVKSVSSGVASYADKKLTTGATYYYKVRAYCKVNGKKHFSAYSDIVSATPVLGKPTNLKAVITGDNEIKLTWDKVPGAETYTILRSTSENGTYKIASEICDTNSFIDTNVKTAKTYYYKVYAVRGDMKSEVTDCVTAVAVSMTVSVTQAVIKTGDHVKVTATVNPAGTVLWTSDNASIAIVTSDGVIYGLKAGTTTVNATASGVTKKITVIVKDQLDGKGIEVSSANGTVDFHAVKASGYEYVILRISSGTTKDSQFETNYTNAKAAGLKVGVSCYAKARNKTDAEKEAYQVFTILNGRAIDYPIVYDMEEVTLLYGLSNTERSDIMDAFKNIVVNVGKKNFILCTSQEWLTKYLDNTRLNGTNLWVTNYRDVSLGHGYTGAGTVVMWRYTNKGTVSGVPGDTTNISISYLNN